MIFFSSKHVLIVEGVNDTKAVRRALDCETIETGGMALTPALPKIREACRRAKVILFTDTDSTGERIRRTIRERVRADLKDARLPPPPGARKAFVEKAKPDEIRHALREAGAALTIHLPVIRENGGE